MPTVIRPPDKLKMRVARAAQRAGTTMHNFILEAIAEKIDERNLCEDFNATADRRYAEIAASGKTISWSKMRGYLLESLEKSTKSGLIR
jgi:predicted DNA-binding protein